MTNDDKPQFFRAMLALAETWKEPMSDLRLEGYWIGLKDLSVAELEQAVTRAIQRATYFPRPVELREMVYGNPAHNAEIAWMAWQLAARRLGGGASVVVEDAALAETLRQIFGGWPEACAAELSPEMWASKRKEFDRVYGVMSRRGFAGIRYMPGSHERNNSERSDWQRFTPVGVISGPEVKQISGVEAERFRIEATRNNFLAQ